MRTHLTFAKADARPRRRALRSARVRRAAAILLFLWPAGAHAHDTWLLPSRGSVPPGARIALELTSGMRFPEPESPVAPERLAATGIRLAGEMRPLETPTPGPNALHLSAPVGSSGVAVLWAETRPRSIELNPDQVRHYLAEIGAMETIGRAWEGRPSKAWRESYVKLAKTYVRCGDPGRDPSWAEPVGLALEIVPEKDPAALRAGDELPVRLLWKGEAHPGLQLAAVAAGASEPQARRTDADGRAVFALDRAGAWMLRATLVRESPAPGAGWVSHFTTLTLAVGEGRGSGGEVGEAGGGSLLTPTRVVDAFFAALTAGDRAGALATLAPELVVFEEGEAEMSREVYAGEHLEGDLEYGRGVTVRLLDERSGESGEVAWVLRRTETTGSYGGKAVATRDTATFLLRRTAEGWRITHVHWSSRPLER